MSCDWALRDDQLVASFYNIQVSSTAGVFKYSRSFELMRDTVHVYTPMLNFEWSSNLHLFLNPVWDGLVITHLPEGPTLHFKLSSVRLTTEIKVSDNKLFQFWLLLAEQCRTEVTLICWGSIFMDFTFPSKCEFF